MSCGEACDIVDGLGFAKSSVGKVNLIPNLATLLLSDVRSVKTPIFFLEFINKIHIYLTRLKALQNASQVYEDVYPRMAEEAQCTGPLSNAHANRPFESRYSIYLLVSNTRKDVFLIPGTL